MRLVQIYSLLEYITRFTDRAYHIVCLFCFIRSDVFDAVVCLVQCRTNQIGHTGIKDSKLLVGTLLYVGYLAGNIPTVRLPAMLAAREATGTEAGTKKGELVGVIAIGMSVFVNVAFVTAAALVGQAILSVLPQFVLDAFNFVLPAILGAVMAQYWEKNKVFVPGIFVACLIINKLPLGIFKFPGAITLSIICGIVIFMNKKKKEAA